MNPGVVEEGGKVAIGTIDALKSQPIVLALIVLQLLVLGAVLYSTMHRQEATTKQFTALYALLQQCLTKAP
jgi:preprotein translocase subunit SecY